MEVTLPSGRVVIVEEYDVDRIVVKWTEGGVEHKLVLPKGMRAEDVDNECEKYLYGYIDPETGEKVPGYFDLIKETTTASDNLIVM